MRITDLPLRGKLLSGFGVVLAMAGLVVGFAVVELHELNAKASAIAMQALPSVALTGAMNTNTSDFRAAQFEHIVSTTAERKEDLERRMNSVLAQFEANRKRYLKHVLTQDEHARWEAFEKDWNIYMSIHQQMLQLSRDLKVDQAQALLNSPSGQGFVRSSDTLDGIIAKTSEEAERMRNEAQSEYESALRLLVAAIASMLGASLAIALVLSGRIAGDMHRAKNAVSSIARGDLTAPIRARSTDEVGLMMNALAAMQAQFASVVHGIRTNAETVAAASTQIAQGNRHLSERTEEQAAALEQTATTMDQVSSTIQSNADNARLANELALNASELAGQGGEAVERVVQTMREITESSGRISEILGVIDAIAFQTNILALNAAVEAARAGEGGRGFAVVATEVRALAQRSAEASKQIKTLIGGSSQCVELGAVHVHGAGEKMREIVAAIGRVSQIVAEISSASAEQAVGVAQVGEAVTQIDKATQQNAALVEEAAAAALSLQSQATTLVGSVAHFVVAR